MTTARRARTAPAARTEAAARAGTVCSFARSGQRGGRAPKPASARRHAAPIGLAACDASQMDAARLQGLLAWPVPIDTPFHRPSTHARSLAPLLLARSRASLHLWRRDPSPHHPCFRSLRRGDAGGEESAGLCSSATPSLYGDGWAFSMTETLEGASSLGSCRRTHKCWNA